MYKIYIILILCSICFTNCVAQKIESDKKTAWDQKHNVEKVLESKYVYDYESLLSMEEREKLEEVILKLNQDTGNVVLIVTTHSIGPFPDFRSYATNLGNIYNQETKNNDIVIIVVSKVLKKVEIVTSDKAKKMLTDNFCKMVIDKSFIPEFKTGKFYKGILQGVNDVITKWK